MRYKPKRENPFPVRLDATDLDVLLKEVCPPNTTMTIETERKVFDGVEDLIANLHAPTRLETIVLHLPEQNEDDLLPDATIVPRIEGWGATADVLMPQIRSFLLHCRRPKIPLIAIAIACLASVALVLVRFSDDIDHQRLTSPMLVAIVLCGVATLTMPVIMLRSRDDLIVPKRRGPSFIRRHFPTWLGATIIATVSVLISALVRELIG